MMLRKRFYERVPDESEPVCKQLKHQDYLSALPTELLLMIFGYLKKKENSIKSLAQTCSRFNQILTPQLELHLDFDRIMHEGYPCIQRSYEFFKVYGSEIDIKQESIAKLFESSRFERKMLLTIGKSDQKTKVKLRTLLFLLRQRNIIFLHMQNLKVLAPQLKLEAIQEHEFPKLSRLITLMMNDNKGPFLSAFKKKASDLKALIVINQIFTKEMRDFVSSQKLLWWLYTSDYIEMKADNMPLLEKFEFNFQRHLLNSNQDVFAFAPKIKHLKMVQPSGDLNVALLLSNKSTTIHSIEVEHTDVPTDFTVDRLLPFYPSLIEFKSSNYQWSKK